MNSPFRRPKAGQGPRPRPRAGRQRLSLETLEPRDLPASGPFVVAVTPATPQSSPLTTIQVTFGEAIDPSTFTLTTNQGARAAVATQLTGSPEGLKARVGDLYTTFLRREASAQEAAGFAGLLGESTQAARARGAADADADVASQLVSSEEYYASAQNFPSGTTADEKWLDQAYQDLLGRQPTNNDPTSRQLQTLSSNPGSAGRLAVAYGMTAGDEYERNLIAGMENQYLGANFGRPAPATDAGINALVAQLDQGAAVAGVVASMIASPQFYASDGGLIGLGAGLDPALQQGSAPSAVAYGDFTGRMDAHGNPSRTWPSSIRGPTPSGSTKGRSGAATAPYRPWN